MLKLNLQYVGHLMWRTDSLEKTLMLERLKVRGEGDNRGWDGWMAISTRWIGVWVSSRDGQVIWHAGVHGVAKSQTWLSNWTKLYWTFPIKQLEKEEQTKPKASRRKKIVKIRAEINEIETKKTIAKKNETKSCFIEKINWISKSFARLIKKEEDSIKLELKKGKLQLTPRKYKGS